MTKLFDDMTFDEKLNHIEKLQKEAAECIRNGEPSNLADIADHIDFYGPWMLKALRAKPTPTPDQWKQIREALEFASQDDLLESNKEYHERFEYKYKDWFQDKTKAALALMDEIEEKK